MIHKERAGCLANVKEEPTKPKIHPKPPNKAPNNKLQKHHKK